MTKKYRHFNACRDRERGVGVKDPGKDVFFVYTYGAEKKGYTEAIKNAISGKNANILGEYGCFGFNTFGPFKLIGGIAKNHPNDDEINKAISFYKNLYK